MFEISGTLGEKILFGGKMIRNSSMFKMILNTEAGVCAYIEEQKPFKYIKIIDTITKEDMTDCILQKLNDKQIR
jgi:hypothetical protein